MHFNILSWLLSGVGGSLFSAQHKKLAFAQIYGAKPSSPVQTRCNGHVLLLVTPTFSVDNITIPCVAPYRSDPKNSPSRLALRKRPPTPPPPPPKTRHPHPPNPLPPHHGTKVTTPNPIQTHHNLALTPTPSSQPSRFPTSTLHQRDPRSALFENYTGDRNRPASASPARASASYGYAGAGNYGGSGAGASGSGSGGVNGGFRPATPNSR